MRILYCDYKMSPSADNFVAGLKAQIPDCEVECWKYTDDNTLIKNWRSAGTFNCESQGRRSCAQQCGFTQGYKC